METVIFELVEDTFADREVPEFGLPESDYGRSLDHLVQANVDVIPHDHDGRILLGYRKDVPLRDMLWVFGGRMKRGETLADAGARAISREVGFEPDRERLTLDHICNVRWGRRSVPPEERGFQTLLMLMRYECTAAEAEFAAAADRSHQWIRWYTAAELRDLVAAGSSLIHPFLPVVLRNAGLY